MSAKQTAPNPPAINEITEANFNSWRHHPVTKLVMDFCAQKRGQIADQVLEMWANGTESETSREELRASWRTLAEFEQLQFAHLLQHFKPDQEDDESGSQDHRD